MSDPLSHRLHYVIKRCQSYGINLEPSRPGDGVSRYEFMRNGRTVGFCLGIREAEVWLRGWEEGYHAAGIDKP